jgi:hypothetical protein
MIDTTHDSNPHNISATGPRLISSSEAAKRLGIRPATLRRWRMSGKGPRYVKTAPGRAGRALYDLAELDRWCSERTWACTLDEDQAAAS